MRVVAIETASFTCRGVPMNPLAARDLIGVTRGTQGGRGLHEQTGIRARVPGVADEARALSHGRVYEIAGRSFDSTRQIVMARRASRQAALTHQAGIRSDMRRMAAGTFATFVRRVQHLTRCSFGLNLVTRPTQLRL